MARHDTPPRTPILTILCLAAGIGGVLATTAPAQEPPPSRLELELAGVRVALEELVALSKEQSTDSQTQLLMRRLEVATARLEPEENELRRRRRELENAASQIEQMNRMRSVWEGELADRQGTDPEAEESYRRQIAQFEAERERLERERWQQEQKVLTLEAELEERRALLHALEGEIDRRLGLE